MSITKNSRVTPQYTSNEEMYLLILNCIASKYDQIGLIEFGDNISTSETYKHVNPFTS